jgi:hypothetical protein
VLSTTSKTKYFLLANSLPYMHKGNGLHMHKTTAHGGHIARHQRAQTPVDDLPYADLPRPSVGNEGVAVNWILMRA